jgi:trans-aconitate methyltransferase
MTLYDTYENLPLHKEEVINTVAFAKERLDKNPKKILVLGSGQNTIEISSLHEAFGEPEIVATDIQPKFLDTLMKRLSKNDKRAFDNTYPVHMDIGKPWPMTVSDGEKVMKLDSLPFVFCNIVFNWLTEEEQSEVFKNVSERLSPNGDFILATLTDNWNSDEVKKHIPEQLRKSPFWTILGAIGARRWADQTALEFGIHRPSINDIYKLATDSGLEIKSLDGNRIFWKNPDGKPTAVVVHLKKR